MQNFKKEIKYKDIKERRKMVKKIIGILLVIFLFYKEGFSAPCYGTKLPQKKSFICGLQSHLVVKRNLEDEYGRIKSLQNFFLLSYGVVDWLSIDFKVGSGNITQRSLEGTKINYPTNFAGGYGFRLKLYDKENIKMVLGFQHISVHPRHTLLEQTKNQAILDDWQGSFLVSYGLKRLTYYLGAKYSRMDYIHRVNGKRKRKMSDLTKSLGLVLGFDFDIDEKTYLNIETQFLDVKAFSFSLNYKF